MQQHSGIDSQNVSNFIEWSKCHLCRKAITHNQKWQKDQQNVGHDTDVPRYYKKYKSVGTERKISSTDKRLCLMVTIS